jgi:hypothetical protein
MNELVTVQPAQSYGLVPTTMSEAMQLATMMASAKLVPAALQKSPADCLMVIQQAIRWQMDPFAVAQECSVIQGKLMHSGKLVAAVINARGGLADRLSFSYEGQGDDRTITVSGRVSGEAEPRTVTVRLRDAKTANRVWQTQPDQQLMYHGSRVWARRHAPELMLGVYSPEEFDEPVPLRSKVPPRPAANVMLPAHDPDTGEVQQDALDELLTSPPTRDDAADQPAPPASSTAQAGAGEIEETATERFTRLDRTLQMAATKGTAALEAEWKKLDGDDRKILKAALDRRHKTTAREVDRVKEAAQ